MMMMTPKTKKKGEGNHDPQIGNKQDVVPFKALAVAVSVVEGKCCWLRVSVRAE